MRIKTGLRRRRAFTLLELLLAVGLSLTLLLAVYQALRMHHVQLEAGREIAEHAQLVRGIYERLRSDIRLVYTGYEAPGSGAQAQSADGSSASSSASTSLTEYETPSGGVHGQPDWVALIVRQAPDDLDYSSNAASSVSPLSDVRMVRYRMGVMADGREGLIREEHARPYDSTLGGDPTLGANQAMIADEVRRIDFQFSDGFEWLAEWDSLNSSAPVEIMVTMLIAYPETENARQRRAAAGMPERLAEYRFVVSLPEVTRAASPEAAAESREEAASAAQGQTGGAPQQ